MSYEKINKIKRRTRDEVFVMAVTYLLDKGYEFCTSLTDEDIEEVEGSGMMTKEFSQCLIRLAREISQAGDNPIEIVQFCSAEDVFDLNFYCGKFRRHTLITLIGHLLQYGNIGDDDLRADFDIDDDDWGMLKDEIVQCGF